MTKKQMASFGGIITTLIIILIFLCIDYFEVDINKILNSLNVQTENTSKETVPNYNVNDIPEYSGNAYITLNGNTPEFTEEDYQKGEFETYGNLDSLGRCTKAYANVSQKTMPTEKRGSIGMIKPTGWHTIKYDNVDGKYLYNRCHLIGYQLTGENANEKNLITCTRFMNAETMLKFENEVAEYIKETNNHVLYRVTPYFKDDNLLATGVQMEAYSIEDNGKGISFNVFVYNVQDGISIDYTNGNSKRI